MKRLVISLSVFLLGTVAGWAADMPTKYSAPVAPAAMPDWSGFYIGAALGGKWMNSTWTTTSVSDLPGGVVDASSPRGFSPAGFRAGGYAGYNWQVAQWVFGLEGDLAWSNPSKGSVGIPGCTINCGFAPGPGVDTSSVTARWDASLRARLGYLVMPDFMLYGTGGAAWQEIASSGTCQHDFADPVCSIAAGSPLDTQSNKEVRTGWTVGGGLEKLYGNWLLRAEYRFSQFGTANHVLPFGITGGLIGQDYVRYGLSAQTHIGTIGIAYKFGGPVVAKY
jgi:outer membrane immunogenic protein